MSLLALPVPAKSSNFFEKVIEVCTKHHCSITSWIRSPKHNALVGGVPTSKHLSGYAVDAILDSDMNYEAFVKDARSLGLKAIIEGDHVHLEEPNALGINNNAGVDPDRRHTEDMGHEPESESGKSGPDLTSSERQSKGTQASKRFKEQGSTVHAESDSYLSRVCNYSVAEICTVLRYPHSSRMDRIQSWISVDGRKGCNTVASDGRSCPDPTRYPFSICDSRAIFRWVFGGK